MIELTEPQVWVLMGIFATAIFGMLGWQTASFNRNLMIVRDSLRESLEMQFTAQDARLEVRFAAIDNRLDGLDRDVQAIARHVFGSDPR
ncbi:MAG TPA: hypothetical protein PKI99_00850 [Terrimesophilobacter sp.]|nr:hypothetical protein [Terrimesophilobacter sp.]